MGPSGNGIGVDGVMGDDGTGGSCINSSSLVPFSGGAKSTSVSLDPREVGDSTRISVLED